jgi:hypothetical protein
VTADPGPAIPSYDVDAAFMLFQQHESGIHALWSGAGEGSVTEVRFRCAAAHPSSASYADVLARPDW